MREFDGFVDKINAREAFSLARYNDGECYCILQDNKHRNPEHEYYPDLGERLDAILKSSPGYYIGVPHYYMDSSFEIRKLFWDYDIKRPVYVNLFHRASELGKIQPLWDALSQRRVAVVGPDHLRRFDKFGIDRFFFIPPRNCWLNYTEILGALIKSMACSVDWVFIFCASLMSKVLVDDLYRSSVAHNVTLLDLGSVLDPYVGVFSRSYMKGLPLCPA